MRCAGGAAGFLEVGVAARIHNQWSGEIAVLEIQVKSDLLKL
jgi:hypothetical protein